MRTQVIPLIVGALGLISKNLRTHLKEIGMPNRTLQKLAIFGTANILRKVLQL